MVFNNKKKSTTQDFQQPSNNLYSTISYKNVNLIRKYISTTGKIIPRHNRRLTSKEHRIIAKCIRRARRIRIVPFYRTSFQRVPW
jgi:ribosomal protein S18